MIRGTNVETVTKVLLKLSRRRHFQVLEITFDMAPNMEKIARIYFPSETQVIDKFYIQKLVFDAVIEIRIKSRWEAIDKESIEMCYAKSCGREYKPKVFENGDSLKLLLERSRYLLLKKRIYGHHLKVKEQRYYLENIMK